MASERWYSRLAVQGLCRVVGFSLALGEEGGVCAQEYCPGQVTAVLVPLSRDLGLQETEDKQT